MLALLKAAADVALEPPDYGASLLQTLLALAAVCLLAYAAVRFGLGRFYRATSSGRRMRIVERLPIDGRRALLLVEIDGRTFLLGAGEGAAPVLLTEMRSDAPSFREVLDHAGDLGVDPDATGV